MSEKNVELVRASVDAFNRADLDSALEAMHPEVAWRTLEALPDVRTYRGREGVREFWQTWHDTFSGFHLHLDDCVPAGEHQVISTLRASGEGAGSGAGVESPRFFQVLEVRDGQIVSARMFATEREALDAAGVED